MITLLLFYAIGVLVTMAILGAVGAIRAHLEPSSFKDGLLDLQDIGGEVFSAALVWPSTLIYLVLAGLLYAYTTREGK